MDKHQRKHLARWEQKKAKEQRKYEEYVKNHSRINAMKHALGVVEAYIPDSGVVFHKAHSLLTETTYPIRGDLFLGRDDRIWGDDWNTILLIYDFTRSFLVTAEEIEHTIEKWKKRKEDFQAFKIAEVLRCHRSRLNLMREELTEKTDRLRTIQNCALIKEELMMNVWHPRRVEKFLDTYGWDAYDNLLGVE